MDNTELLWKQYQLHIETYKFYLSITVKLITFYFAIAGAILSFYYANIENPSVKFALYLPWCMAMGLFIFFAMGAALSTVSRNDVFNIRDKLKLQVSPDLIFLTYLLAIFSLSMLACIIGLSYILWG